MSAAEVPTLFEWAGGAAAIRRLIDAFYDRVEHDDVLAPFFPGGVSEAHRAHVTDWWSEVFGGPPVYTESHGGYARMLDHHRNLDITAEQRFRFAMLMSLAADAADLPDDPEFRAALVGYLEWGTRLALANSQPDAVVVEQAPVPRWGWGVAPPYQPWAAAPRQADRGCGFAPDPEGSVRQIAFAPDVEVQRFGRCHLNRQSPALLNAAGFTIRTTTCSNR